MSYWCVSHQSERWIVASKIARKDRKRKIRGKGPLGKASSSFRGLENRRRSPGQVLRFLTETPEQRARGRTWNTGADRPLVDRDDRYQFARRAGEKCLVRTEQIVVSQNRFAHRYTDVAADLEYERPRD